MSGLRRSHTRNSPQVRHVVWQERNFCANSIRHCCNVNSLTIDLRVEAVGQMYGIVVDSFIFTTRDLILFYALWLIEINVWHIIGRRTGRRDNWNRSVRGSNFSSSSSLLIFSTVRNSSLIIANSKRGPKPSQVGCGTMIRDCIIMRIIRHISTHAIW